MLKKTIKYVDYNGVERCEDFYFNLSKAEVTEMQVSEEGGYDQMLQRIVDAQNNKEIFKHFKAIILKAYGVKSQDGKRFIKSEELSEEFSQTEAFVELIMELASSETAAAEFVNGIIPKPTQQVTPLNK
nr:MAG TPA: hypothetical protein [Caudoviricetes sp.]